MKGRLWMVVSIIFLVMMVVSCAPEEVSTPEATTEIEAPAGKAIVETVCTGCHSLNKITTASYDKDGWQKTVERMISKGAELDNNQKELVIDYLASAFPKK